MELKAKCNKCGGKALQMFVNFECVTTGCSNFSQKLVDEYVGNKTLKVPYLKKITIKLPVSSFTWNPAGYGTVTVNPAPPPSFQVGDTVEVTNKGAAKWFGMKGTVTSHTFTNIYVDLGPGHGMLPFGPRELSLVHPAGVGSGSATSPTTNCVYPFKFQIGDKVQGITSVHVGTIHNRYPPGSRVGTRASYTVRLTGYATTIANWDCYEDEIQLRGSFSNVPATSVIVP